MPATNTAQQELEILNRLGLHARPAAEFVRCARHFASRIEIVARGQVFSAQRVVDVLLAGLSAGARFELVAEGPDAVLAVDTLAALLRQLAEIERTQAAEADSYHLRRFDHDD